MKKQIVAIIISLLPAIVAGEASAAERANPSSPAGFYGGIKVRDSGGETNGMTLGIPATALSRFSSVIADDSATRSLFFGGYRWRNDVAVEASFNSADPYSLKPAAGLAAGRGVGLVPTPASLGLAELPAHSWNLDLFTSWNFYRNLALYGRMGYAQTDLAPTLASGISPATDARRLRDGINYGVGVRYNMSSALGLRLEYGRFGRFAGDLGSTPLESDQVTFGVQLRF